MIKFLILIPPSEGKSIGGNKAPLKKLPKHSKFIVDQWNGLSASQWEKLLGVKEKALAKAIETNNNIESSKTLPAIERYSGVVYNAIDYQSLSLQAKKNFDKHVRIISAVFGLLKPKDLIPDYKCKINHFGADKHWKNIYKDNLKDIFVIDLLPQTHKKAVDFEHGISIDFKCLKNGKLMPAGHNGKHIKGRFVRWLVEQKSLNEETFKKFNEDGYKWKDGNYIKN